MRIRHFDMRDVTVTDESGLRRTVYRRLPSGVTRISHEDEVYDADEHGVFDVPDHVGRVLTGRHGWEEDEGQTFDVPAAPQPRPDELAELRQQVAELRAALETSNRSRAKRPANPAD